MVFSSIQFLFFFLPLVLALYFVLPARFRNWVLIVFSLLFYFWGEGKYIWVMIISMVINFFFGRLIGESKTQRARKGLVALGMICNLIPLLIYKYSGFFATEFAFFFSKETITWAQSRHLPIGISFFTFQGLSYLVDIYRKELPYERKLSNIVLYKSFFPQLIAGPIVRYQTIAKEMSSRLINLNDVVYGLQRFVWGLSKKVLIANPVASVADAIFKFQPDQLDSGTAWLGALAYTIQIYFDFSGYSDMAIGLGRIFGFHFLENFDHPYSATSIKDFWRRWHISLSTWFRDYLYIPLGGNRVGRKRAYLNLFIVFLATGIWHGANWTFVTWGLVHGLFLILERLIGDKAYSKIPPLLKRFYTLLVVVLAWVLFRSPTLEYAQGFIGRMVFLNFSQREFHDFSLYADHQATLVLILGMGLSFPWWRSVIVGFGKNHPETNLFLKSICALFLLVLCCLSLSAGTYNPFIYFRF